GLRPARGVGSPRDAAGFGMGGGPGAGYRGWDGRPPGGWAVHVQSGGPLVLPDPAPSGAVRRGGGGPEQGPALHAVVVPSSGRAAGASPVRPDGVRGGAVPGSRGDVVARASAADRLPRGSDRGGFTEHSR